MLPGTENGIYSWARLKRRESGGAKMEASADIGWVEKKMPKEVDGGSKNQS